VRNSGERSPTHERFYSIFALRACTCPTRFWVKRWPAWERLSERIEVAGAERPLADEERAQDAIVRLDRRTADAHVVLGALTAPPEGVRQAGGGLKENEDSAALVVGQQLLDQGGDRGRHPIPAARQRGVLQLADLLRRQAGAHETGKAVGIPFLPRPANHIATAQVLQIVGEGGERLDDIVDVRDVFLPLRLLVLSPGELG